MVTRHITMSEASTEFFGEPQDDFDEVHNIAKATLSAFNKSFERFVLVTVTYDKANDKIEIQELNTTTPLLTGVIGSLLYRSYVDSYTDRGLTDMDALNDIGRFLQTADFTTYYIDPARKPENIDNINESSEASACDNDAVKNKSETRDSD